jgi:tripartite-type tricarboxylate transporter receptor subunit TctC
MFDTVVVSRAPAQDGRALPLAVTSRERSPLLPQVPTVRESGVPELRDFEATGWFGVYGPAGLAPAMVERLNAALMRSLTQADVRRALEQAGATVLGSTPPAFAEHNRREVERWSSLVKRLRVKVD